MYIGKNYYEREVYHPTLTCAEQEMIYRATIRILSEQGMLLDHPEALELLRENGAVIKDGNKVYLPPHLLQWALDKAPKQFTIYDRDGNAAIHMGGNNVYFGTGSDTVSRIDYNTKEPVPWLKRDVENAVHLCDYLPNIDFVMSMGIISDVHWYVNTREQYATMIRNTTKPLEIVADNVTDLKDIYDMLVAVRGSEDELKLKPYACVYNEPTSPRVHPFESIDKLMFCARHSLPTNYTSGGMAGATVPLSPVAAIAMTGAECLFGLVIHQLVNPGAPFVYCGVPGGQMDMRTVQCLYGAPATLRGAAAAADMANFYNLPTWGCAGMSNSKICDAQSAMEAMQTIDFAIYSGGNLAHDVGYMNFGFSMSFESLVMCNEMIGRSKEIHKGVIVNEESLMLDAIERVGFNGDFLREKYTRENMRKTWVGDLSDNLPATDWLKQGATNMTDRAHKLVEKIITTHQPEPLDENVDKVLEGILDKAREKAKTMK